MSEKPSKSVPGIVGRGLIMGIAEVVPGVSGGTIAFVTGIYEDLVNSLARFGPASVVMLGEPKQFWAHHNLRFLLSLAAGMALGVVTFARLMHYLLANFEPAVWGFFCGVILMSVFIIGRVRARGALLVWGPLGFIAGISLLFLPVGPSQTGLLQVFAGGAVAVCAWLLPAVSGSYVLLALGLYESIIGAIAGFDLTTLGTLALGCATGIILFARLLAWLMRHYTEQLLSLLTGFMLGAVAKLWPWQPDAEAGGFVALATPQQYVDATGSPDFLPWVVLMALIGGALLWLMTRVSRS